MKQTFTFSQKLGQLLAILLPVLVSQIAIFAMSFFDTIMSGHASSVDLAGVAIGSSIWAPVSAGLTGIVAAVTPILAQHLGGNRREQIPFTLAQGIYLSIALALGTVVVGVFALQPILSHMDLEEGVRSIAFRFLVALSFGIIPLFLYTAFRSFIDAHGKTRVTMLISLVALPVNIALNYVLIFGKLGFPRMGGVGAGVASAITYWVIAAISLLVIVRHESFSQYRIFHRMPRISFAAWKELLRIGVPIGLSVSFEVGVFAVVTLLMSGYSTTTIAAHQAAINFASFLYMIPYSISTALTIMVGFEVGAKRPADSKQYSFIGLFLAAGLAIVCAAFLFLFNKEVAALYTTDMDVLTLTQHFLLYAIFFQMSDAIAAPIQGALRGYKDVNVTFIVAFISYWVIGLPVGYALAAYTSMGAFGYWIGLITGLAVGAVCLLARLLFIQRRFQKGALQGKITTKADAAALAVKQNVQNNC
ncbi:MATE family efflux transporter [Brevibacillus fluminis]|uniref:Probable multidrug resistance protein NorM n=1 Tax=Brevibacillus fluminis TaxID=511487 RepID=A0A3M8DSL8_9BACL|nr:MATE family efflux transporter [Brevibacillus fluminis]RNB91163.1 MATE family efflux transporter [Brevibacillus fluminis]